MVKSMIDNGLIRKERVPEDARKYRLYMTEKAKRSKRQACRLPKTLDQSFYEGVLESDLKVFKGVLWPDCEESGYGLIRSGKGCTRFAVHPFLLRKL